MRNKFLLIAIILLIIPIISAVEGNIGLNLNSPSQIDYSLIPTVNSSDYWDNRDTPADITYDEISGGDVNALGYTGTFSFLSGNVGGIDMTGDPWWLSGTDLELEQDLIVDGNITLGGNLMPDVTLSSDIGSGANRWNWLYVRNISTEWINAYNGYFSDNLYVDGLINGVNISNIYSKTEINNSFVPYSGAINNVVLGTKNISTTAVKGTINASYLGADKVTNGNFDLNANGWTLDTWAWNALPASILLAPAKSSKVAQQNINAEAGKTYNLTYTIVVSGVSHTIQPSIGGTNGASKSASGTYSELIIATNTNNLTFTGSTGIGSTIILDTISVKEVVPSEILKVFNDGGFDFNHLAWIDNAGKFYSGSSRDISWRYNNSDAIEKLEVGTTAKRYWLNFKQYIFDNDIVQTKGNATINNIYGGMYFNNNAGTAFPFASRNVWYNFTGLTCGDINGFYCDGTNGVLTAQIAGEYVVRYSATGLGGNNEVYNMIVSINGTVQNNTISYEMTSAGEPKTMNGGGHIRLNAGSYVTLQIRDWDGTSSGTVYNANIIIDRIGN
jgi:hypothetical protein